MREYLTKLYIGETLWGRKPAGPCYLLVCFIQYRHILTKGSELFRLNSTRTVSHSTPGIGGRILKLSPP
jgi:hypothetical protein